MPLQPALDAAWDAQVMTQEGRPLVVVGAALLAVLDAARAPAAVARTAVKTASFISAKSPGAQRGDGGGDGGEAGEGRACPA